MAKTIYYVRHGECQANADGVLAGMGNDSPLTALGRQQAQEAAAQLKELPIELIVTSPLVRAHDTAKIIAKQVGYKGGIRIEPLFAERDFGTATGLELNKAFAMLDSPTSAEGAESGPDFHTRVLRALDSLRTLPQRHILVVAHGAVGKMVGAIVTGLEPHEFLKHKSLANSDLYEFKLD